MSEQLETSRRSLARALDVIDRLESGESWESVANDLGLGYRMRSAWVEKGVRSRTLVARAKSDLLTDAYVSGLISMRTHNRVRRHGFGAGGFTERDAFDLLRCPALHGLGGESWRQLHAAFGPCSPLWERWDYEKMGEDGTQ